MKSKYELEASYETFKRFARHQGLSRRERRRMIRIELPAGWETQLDYGHVGSLMDPSSQRVRGVWAFCGVLDVMTAHHSRPYFEEVCQRARRRSVSLPATLRRMLEAVEKHPLWQEELPLSATGTQMIRDIGYYIGNEEVPHGATARTAAAVETAEDARDVAGA